MADRTPTVFVVDDDASVRKSLSRLLRSAGHEVELFASADEFLAAGGGGGRPGCIILDLQMPGRTGMELQEELCKASYSLPVVFVTGHGDVPQSVKAMKGGAEDFLQKPFDGQALLEAVRRALERDRGGRSAHREAEAVRARMETLTPRERELVPWLLTGLLNKQIADRLGIVEKTVKVHRGRVMEKMGVRSIAELVRRAQAAGISPASDRPAAP
jgi:FixJ family two-component response regulator